MNLKLDEMKGKLHALETKILTVMLSVAGTGAVILITAVLQFVLRK